MNPLTRLSWTLGASLLIWIPVAFSTISGRIDHSTALLYYLIALAIAYFGTGIVSKIFSGYRETIDRAEETKRHIEMLEEQAASEHRRRSTDIPPEQGAG